MDAAKQGNIIYMTVVQTAGDLKAAELMIESLRTFGGSIGQRPVWVFVPPLQPGHILKGEGVELFELDIPGTVKGYLFVEKVFACAQAERLANGQAHSLVWIDPEVLIVNPPLSFDLGHDCDAAFRPVHIKNVGLFAEEALDGFWSKIYSMVGESDVQKTVETYVDQQLIRAYFNTHTFAINPVLGLLNIWAGMFQALVEDQNFQSSYCKDDTHQVFLFQALLSALLVSRVEWGRIRILPSIYNYPYNLQIRLPKEQRALAINDLVCIAYEGRSLKPSDMDDIRVNEPVRGWLERW